ncbi:hypothetical protein ACSSNL_01595 [Thalassobius sp. S69A]|uniref:hypothetical protein n=1 Tax=unclassified Thalassovita TaxID=2619711 RepID=UPI003C7D8C86
MTNTPQKARIEVFRPGTFSPMVGAEITFSAADLKAVADAYDPETAPAPIVVGHPSNDTPAYGWIEGLEYDESQERLFADLHEIEPQFSDLVKAGRFKKVSMSFFGPDHAANPNPGAWYPKHVGFLGAAAPAVSGLKNVAFSGAEGVTFEFGERGFEEAASLFRGLRDFFIERFSLEVADKVLPSWRIEWLDDTEIEPKDGNGPTFTAPVPQATPPSTPKPEKDPVVTKSTEAEFADREAKLKDREDKLAEREKKAAHDDNVSFAESLIEAGKLIPASKDELVAVLDAMPADQSVSFSEGGDDVALGDAVRKIFEAQPEVVSYGALDLPDGPAGGGAPASFAADGKPVDPDSLKIHNQALAYQRKNPGTSYEAAIDAVS